MRQIPLFLVGFGHVGQRFVQLLDESRPALVRLGVDPIVVGVATRRHGLQFNEAGLDPFQTTRAAVADDRRTAPASPAAEYTARLRSLKAETRVLVETTTLDVRSGEPAIGHVRAGLAGGAHVISANKGPAAFAYDALTAQADAAGLSFLFEGAVMDGIPVLNLVRECLPAADIRGFRGVINSTTNHILTAMERGESFDSALGRMQAEGVAEADPSLDIDGWDAAAKVAVLANVWLGAKMTPALVRREGISAMTARRIADARTSGRRVKLVARAARTPVGVNASVALEELDHADPLGQLDGQGNALEIDTWPAGRIVITQRDGGLEKTAYALVSDLITVARQTHSRSTDRGAAR
jgi:homoserine dehydrogenase